MSGLSEFLIERFTVEKTVEIELFALVNPEGHVVETFPDRIAATAFASEHHEPTSIISARGRGQVPAVDRPTERSA